MILTTSVGDEDNIYAEQEKDDARRDAEDGWAYDDELF